MIDNPEVERPESVTPPTGKPDSAPAEATDADRWLASALELLERTSARLVLHARPGKRRS
jgi:hypothetical protein